MRCQVCKKITPTERLAPIAISQACRHSLFMCLDCVVDSARRKRRCPYRGCDQPVRFDEETESIKGLNQALQVFCPKPIGIGPIVLDWETTAPINIEMFTGKKYQNDVTLRHTVLNLKGMLMKSSEIHVNKQKLIFRDNEMKNFLTDGKTEARLGDFGIKANVSLWLIKILYALPAALTQATFDLYWGYPEEERDYLDASCIAMYKDGTFIVVDYSARNFDDAIFHSGDVMDDENKIGHHTIQVYLDRIPSDVTHMFFTLSAWNSPNISHFKNPSLRFYDICNPKKDLCSTRFKHALNFQAVVMCSLSRQNDQWHVFESGKTSSGNAKDYEPLAKTIQKLIKMGV